MNAMKRELVTIPKATLSTCEEALKEVVEQYERAWRTDGYYDVNGKVLHRLSKAALAAMNEARAAME